MKKILTIILITLSANITHAQLIPNLGGQRAGTAAFTFLKLSNSPKMTAMAGTGIAIPGDAYSASINPATMVDVKQSTFAVSNSLYFSDMQNAYISAIFPSKKYSVWSVNLQSFRSDAMEVRTEFQPGGTGQYFYTQNLGIGLSYAKILSDYFSYGVTAKYVYEGIDQYTVHSGVIDLGFLYKTDFKDLRFAVMVNNFGVNTKIDGQTKALTTFSSNNPDINNYAAPTLFKMGLSLVPYKDSRNNILVAAELHHPNDNSENIRLGVEYSWMNIFSVRAGYKIGVKDASIPTFGLGLRTRAGRHPLRIDYAADPHPYLGFAQQIGLQLSLNKDKN